MDYTEEVDYNTFEFSRLARYHHYIIIQYQIIKQGGMFINDNNLIVMGKN